MKEKAMWQLTQIILPYWKKLIDKQNGGFYGYVDFDLNVNKNSDKGVILNSRILWFFSNAYKALQSDDLLDYASHAFDFLQNNCIDQKNQGVYWLISCNGTVVDNIKHIYNQAFAIYALSSYYNASKNAKSLDLALELFDLIESKANDGNGYLDAFSVSWQKIENDKLSENGVKATKTMNTFLHILEAYTLLYQVSGNERVKSKLCHLLKLFSEKVYNSDLCSMNVFFDVDLHSLADLESYGHNIEAAWLLDLAASAVDYKDKQLISRITSTLVARVVDKAWRNDGSLSNECMDGKVDTTRVWWVQAEAVVGFINEYQKQGEQKYLLKANLVLDYINEFVTDKRKGGEWFWELDENNHPAEKPITEPWKCPYHNGRMCFEILRRLSNDKV